MPMAAVVAASVADGVAALSKVAWRRRARRPAVPRALHHASRVRASVSSFEVLPAYTYSQIINHK